MFQICLQIFPGKLWGAHKNFAGTCSQQSNSCPMGQWAKGCRSGEAWRGSLCWCPIATSRVQHTIRQVRRIGKIRWRLGIGDRHDGQFCKGLLNPFSQLHLLNSSIFSKLWLYYCSEKEKVIYSSDLWLIGVSTKKIC